MADENTTKTRVVMCRGRWPEENYEDFLVFSVAENETNEQAIERARIDLNDPKDDFYVLEVEPVKNATPKISP